MDDEFEEAHWDARDHMDDDVREMYFCKKNNISDRYLQEITATL